MAEWTLRALIFGRSRGTVPERGDRLQGEPAMQDWNVVVSVHDGGFTRACQLLDRFGQVKRTNFYNVLVMKVEDRAAFLDGFSELATVVPDILAVISRVMPTAKAFDFQNAGSFEAKAREVALQWAPQLAGKSFHVRMHRRGFKKALPSQQEERLLDEALLAAVKRTGLPGRIDFEDPDVILDVETVGNRAAMSLWTREDLHRYPFLKPD